MKLLVGLRVHPDGYLLYTNTILDPIFNIIRTFAYDHLKRKKILTLTSYNFWVSNMIIQYEMDYMLYTNTI